MKINKGQSIVDVALQATGVVSSMYSIARYNGVSVDSMLEEDELEMPELDNVDNCVVEYYGAHGIIPCSGIGGSDLGGIGSVGIEIDFCVRL